MSAAGRGTGGNIQSFNLAEDIEKDLANDERIIGASDTQSVSSVTSNPISSITTSSTDTNNAGSKINIYIKDSLRGLLSTAANADNITLDTETFYEAIDLLGEGPIEGLVDADGNTVNYLGLNADTADRESSLAYGVYYNDISVKDKKTNFLNLTAANFQIALGNEVDNFNDISSAIYTYQSRVYDLDSDPGITEFNTWGKFETQLFQQNTIDTFQRKLISLKSAARNFSHYIKNKYVTSATVNINIDNCFYIGGKGDTYSNNIRFVVSVTDLSSRSTSFFYFQGYFVVKSTAIILPIEISINRSTDLSANSPEFLINVYSVEKRITAAGEKTSSNSSRSFSVDSIIERVNYGFSYPFSAVCKNIVSAKHFSNIPVRSFDCKLLKIKVPDNYDPDIREYEGDWGGNFSKLLKWTDNPAWIFYDLCINGRYGLARSSMSETDLNKWELYKISKFCDELVRTEAPTKYAPESFTFNNDLLVSEKKYNTISISTTESLESLKAKYPEKGILFIYDLKNEFDEDVQSNYKKVILSVTTDGTTATIKLCNDFGVRKFIESDMSGNFYTELQKYVSSNASVLNTEDNIKKFAISYITGVGNSISNFNSANEAVSLKISRDKIFDSALKIKSGTCVAKQEGYYDFLESRFLANIYINSETEGLKILTDLSSVFRGIFYSRNGLINITTDVKKPVVYIFTNSNVKDGVFNYTSSNLESSFSVAKVSYLDKTDNFKDKVVYVEDAELIKKYGLIEKEILGFGITSKYQANRIGRWFLLTGKLESQTVNFSTGIEATNLKIGDIIRVADNLKISKLEFGKIVSLDFKNNYVYIDRELKQDVLGKKIKIFSIVNDEPLESTLNIFEASNGDLRLKLLEFDYFNWYIKAGIIASNNNQILTADSSIASGWNKKAYTNQSYIDNCSLYFTIPDFSNQSAIGLSEVYDLNVSYTDITYLFRFNGSTYYVEITGATVYTGTFALTDSFSITYSENYIRFYRNNIKIYETARQLGNSLYAVCALNTQYASIENIVFSEFPITSYGKFSNLRADANFSIYIENNTDKEDLYRIIGITESSSNDYNISALKYSNEKFTDIDKDEYIDKNQYVKKQIVFSTDEYIQPLFSDSIINANIKTQYLSYVDSINNIFDYSFIIETEVLNPNFNLKNYMSIEIDFESLFNTLSSSLYIYGVYCNIIKDGKILKFKVLKNEASKISVFLGEKRNGSIQNTVAYDIDFYAFDSKMKLINV